jgi:predicted Zn-dependent protease
LRAGIDTDKVQQKAHLIKACTIDPQQWRYCRDLTQYYLNNKEYKKALQTVKPMYERQKDNFQIGSLYVRTLVCNQDYDAADKVLSAITILPFEGEQSGRNLYSEVKLMRALKALGDGKYAQARDIIAEARKWPHNVGVGKPFDNEIDNRFVDWLTVVACDRAGDKAGAEESARKVSSSTFSGGVYDVIKALATAGQGDAAKADQIMKSFASSQDDSNGLKTWGVKYYNANKGKKYPLDYTELSRMVRATFGIEEVHIMY